MKSEQDNICHHAECLPVTGSSQQVAAQLFCRSEELLNLSLALMIIRLVWNEDNIIPMEWDLCGSELWMWLDCRLVGFILPNFFFSLKIVVSVFITFPPCQTSPESRAHWSHAGDNMKECKPVIWRYPRPLTEDLMQCERLFFIVPFKTKKLLDSLIMNPKKT